MGQDQTADGEMKLRCWGFGLGERLGVLRSTRRIGTLTSEPAQRLECRKDEGAHRGIDVSVRDKQGVGDAGSHSTDISKRCRTH